jgi:predicted dehydrogenase
MFQQRTLGHWLKIRDLIDSGELGKLVRVSWIITDWYRTQIYFSGSEWKATWKGEGGGVLLNQSPHQLDLFQWFFGAPDRITAFASMGKYHHIEVEDEVTGYFQYDNGLIGHFITSTGECPGTNRLEIVGEMGKLIFEDGRLKFFRTRTSMLDYIESSEEPFGTVETWEIDIPYEKTEESGHSTVIENFASCILNNGEPVARAEEGIHSVAMANAMILSSLKNETISLPLDGNRYEEALNELIENSDFRKETTGRSRTGSMKSSF